MTITKKFIDTLAKDNAKLNELKKKVETAKNELKAYCKDNDMSMCEGSSFKVIISERNQVKLNQDKAVEVVLKANAKWLLKQIVDEEKLEEAIRSGEIDGSLFADCWTTKTVQTVTFKKK